MKPQIFVAFGILVVFLITTIIVSFASPSVFTNLVSATQEILNPTRILTSGSTVVVEKVVDGDTLEIRGGDKIRMLNIDTPETVKDNTPVMCGGGEASDFLKSILPQGASVVVKLDTKDRDRFGRLLAFVFEETADTTNIANSYNAQMVKKGYARALIIKPNNTFERYFTGLEREAKNQKLGVWQCEQPFVK